MEIVLVVYILACPVRGRPFGADYFRRRQFLRNLFQIKSDGTSVREIRMLRAYARFRARQHRLMQERDKKLKEAVEREERSWDTIASKESVPILCQHDLGATTIPCRYVAL